MTLAEAITLLIMIGKSFPNLIPAIKDVITAIQLEITGEDYTSEQKAEIAAMFDKADAELEKACIDRLAQGDLEIA